METVRIKEKTKDDDENLVDEEEREEIKANLLDRPMSLLRIMNKSISFASIDRVVDEDPKVLTRKILTDYYSFNTGR